jgi:ribosomal protein L34E
MFRSRSKIKRKVRTPGNNLRVNYAKKKRNYKKCSECESIIHAKKNSRVMSNLCSRCLKNKLIQKARGTS